MTKLPLISLGVLAALALAGCPKLPKGGGSQGADGGSAHVPGTHVDAGMGKAGSSGSAGSAAGTGDMGGAGGMAGAGAGQGGGAGKAGGGGGDAGPGMAVDAGAGTGGSGSVSCPHTCEPYQHCELVQVQCIKAPCPPLPECVDNAACGGFAARPCAGNGKCVDDPRDSCDPQKGGADCGGLCTCVDTVLCIQGKVWDNVACACVDDPCAPLHCKVGTHCQVLAKVASCVDDPASGGPVKCGKTTCPSGEVCCNASCGVCTPPDGACTQQACL